MIRSSVLERQSRLEQPVLTSPSLGHLVATGAESGLAKSVLTQIRRHLTGEIVEISLATLGAHQFVAPIRLTSSCTMRRWILSRCRSTSNGRATLSDRTAASISAIRV
jgi:hypothetical protein